jgi:predicted AAA+ superfamily ATPase
MHGRLQDRRIMYWRDKRRHEIDFVIKRRGKPPIAIECKWKADGFDGRNLSAFRRQHPQGENLVVANDIERIFTRTIKDLKIRFVSLEGLVSRLQEIYLRE